MSDRPRTLRLVSPHMKGGDVAHAQFLLKHNRHKQDYLQDNIDGEFGLATSRACKRAKYWVGYPSRRLNPTFGQELASYLVQKDASTYKRISLAMAIRRKHRLRKRARAKANHNASALKLAHTQVGTHESPSGSNRQKYGEWYGMNGVAWCAIFVSWCFSHAGRALKYSYVPAMVEDARYGRNGLSVTHSPVPGTVVTYNWDGGVADHTGIFDEWANSSHTEFYAIEGNTAVGNDSNGGEVMRRLRYTYQVEAFIRVSAR